MVMYEKGDAGPGPAIESSTVWSRYDYGNYWSDWLSPDTNNDGIVDCPYQIAGGNNTDAYPLADIIAPPQFTGSEVNPFSVVLNWNPVNYTV